MNTALNGTRSGARTFSGTVDLSDPEVQPMLLRLGLAVGDINAASVDRVAYVRQVAATVLQRRQVMT